MNSPQADEPSSATTTPASSAEPAKPKRRGSVAPRSIRGRIMAGVLFIIPLAVTAFLISFVYNQALAVGVRLINWFSRAVLWVFDAALGQPYDVTAYPAGGTAWYHDILRALSDAAQKPPTIDPSTAAWYQNLLAVVLTILMLYLLGWLGSNVAGRRLITMVESLVERIPFVDTVYPAIKQMVQAMSGAGKGDSSQRVVLVDFPHENMQAIGFTTSIITDSTSGRKLAMVYIPTTPNPTSGYVLIVPVERITATSWTMEEALSVILSGGASAKPEVALFPPGTSPVKPVGMTPSGSAMLPAPRTGRQPDTHRPPTSGK